MCGCELLCMWCACGVNRCTCLSCFPGEYLHRLIDVQDIMWADRAAYMGDVDWIDVPVSGLLNTSYAAARVCNLTHSLESARAHAGGSIPAGNPMSYTSTSTRTWPYSAATPSQKRGTTHLVTVDRWGNVVSWTTTIGAWMTCAVLLSGHHVDGAGIVATCHVMACRVVMCCVMCCMM